MTTSDSALRWSSPAAHSPAPVDFGIVHAAENILPDVWKRDDATEPLAS